jgi:hypothetical protein
MSTDDNNLQIHPANAVFALMEDRDFRYSIIRPALEKDKAGVCRLASGKHQLKGFRHLALAPTVMIVPVLSDEANVSTKLARRLLEYWWEEKGMLRELVSVKLREYGYTPNTEPFNADDDVSWTPMKKEHAEAQYDGTFLESEDKNHVMLMSLLLGWFGGDEDAAAADDDAN